MLYAVVGCSGCTRGASVFPQTTVPPLVCVRFLTIPLQPLPHPVHAPCALWCSTPPSMCGMVQYPPPNRTHRTCCSLVFQMSCPVFRNLATPSRHSLAPPPVIPVPRIDCRVRHIGLRTCWGGRERVGSSGLGLSFIHIPQGHHTTTRSTPIPAPPRALWPLRCCVHCAL